MSNDKVIVGLTAAIHPGMPGDDIGVYKKIIKQLEPLKKEFDFDLITVKDPVRSEDDGKRVKTYFDESNVDFTMIFCPSLPYGRAILPLVKVNSYIGIWAVPEPTKNGVLQLNSFCGLNMVGTIIANYFTEYDIPFKWFYDYPDTQLFKDRLRITMKAIRAIKILKNTRIGQVGDLADGFENMYVDERILDKKFGTYIQTRHTVEDIVRRAKAYKDEEINKKLDEINKEGKWNKDHVSSEEMNRMARVNKALVDFAKDNNYNALAISCWTKFQEIYDLAVCGAMGRLNQAGIVAPCEADISSTVIMVVLKALSGKIPTINDMVSLDPDDTSINLWHCGVAGKDWANEDGITWDEHFNIGEQKDGKWNGKGVVADMTFKPGDITVATLLNDFNNLFILTGTVMKNKEAYYGSSGWVNNLKICGKSVDIKELLNTIMTHRVNHHYPTAYDNLYEELAEFAAWKKIKVFKPVEYENFMQNPSLD
jgi:L-fucose isomerase-like protein